MDDWQLICRKKSVPVLSVAISLSLAMVSRILLMLFALLLTVIIWPTFMTVVERNCEYSFFAYVYSSKER